MTNVDLIAEARRMADTSAIYGPEWPNVNAYIVRARTVLPRLADALEAAEAELAGLREIATSGPSYVLAITAAGPSPLSTLSIPITYIEEDATSSPSSPASKEKTP